MKKCLRTGKKALSVFMAVLMAITAMVFVAPQKASAIEAGGYRVTVILWTTNGFDTQDKNGLTLYVNYKKTDAAGTTGQLTYHVNEEWFDTDWGKEVGRDNNHKFTIVDAVIPGFPTSINLPGSKNNDGWVRTDGAFEFDVYVNGTFLYTAKARFEYKDSFNPTFTATEAQLPKATSVVWTKSPSDITIPSDETTVSTTAESYCVDQYGVKLGIEPSYTVTYTPDETKNGLSVSTASDADKASVTVSADKNACLSGDGNNIRTATVHADYNYKGVPVSTDTNPTTKTFKIIDPSYDITLLENGGEIKTETPLKKYWGDSYGSLPYAVRDGYTLIGFYPASEGPQGPFYNAETNPKGDPLTADYIVYNDSSWYPAWRINQYTATFNYKDTNYKDVFSSSKVYVGSAVTIPDIPTEINPNVDHTYIFTGWDSEVVATMPANDVTYTAQYSDTIHHADYTEVETQINAANKKKNEELFKENAYTSETVAALENALSTAVDSNSNKLLKSQQSQVDNIASNLKSAIENLKLKTFTVLFVDESGAIIKDGYYYVNYGDKVEVPTAPEKAFDATYHYEFSKWNSDSNDLSACEKVTDNLKYIAEFNAIEHKFTETVTPSDCSNDGVITRTCDCGYTYTFVNESDKAHHTWSEDYKVLIPATCATEGSEALYCTVCGAIDERSIRTIPALTHDWGKWNEEISATCTGKGMKVRECSRCGGKDVEEIPVAGHKWGETTVVAPTCTNGGYSTRTCTACKITEIFDLTDATGHDLSTKTTVEATCVAAGYKETTCSNDGCDYDLVETIPATGEHTYGDEIVLTTANCISDGVAEKECEVCHKVERTITPKLTEHKFGEWQTLAEAGCTTDEIQIRTCTICGTTETKTIDGTAHHTWDADGNYTVDIPATCTTAGSESIHCTVCGVSNKETARTIEKLGHDYTNARTEKHEQDCVSGEYTKTFCTRSGCDHYELVFAEGEKGEARGHDFANEITVEGKTKAATCTEDGLKVMQCSRCDETEDVVIPKLGHNFNVSGYPVLPTCTTSGYTVMKCTHDGCTETYNEYDENKPALGHLWGEWKVKKASTNTEKGQIEHSCTREGCEAKETAEIPAGEHSFENAVGKVIVPATCKTKGKTEYTCTAHKDANGNNTCGVSITVETEKLPHKLKTVVTYPKCERIQNADGTYTDNFTAGEIKVFCADCGEGDTNATTSLAKPTDHEWGDFQVHTAATCGTAGKNVRYCKKCGAADYKDIPATGNHNFKATTVDATCEERGYTIYACVGCGMTYRDEFTPVLGHDYDDGVAVAATCTTAGGMKYTCKRVFKSEKIVDGEKVTVDVPCGHFKIVEDPNQPATGHNLTDWEYVTHPSDKNAYAKHRHCQNVGCTYSEYETGAGADHEIKGVNAYYQVNFYNEWVTDEYETLTQNEIAQNPIAYTKLAKTYKTERLASVYVLKGTEAEYPGKVPVRGKDINYGGYDFEGWTDKKGFGRSLKHEPEERESSEGLIIDLSNINANTEAYALFRSKDVYYTVCFANPYNNQGSTRLTRDFKILHGHEITFTKDGKPYDYKPSMAENNQVKYEFTGWNYDINHIYDNVTVIARYNSIKKVYTLVYHDYDGNIVGRESITYGGAAQNVPTVAEKPEDDTYIYRNLNKWTLADKTTEVNLSNFTSVPENAKEGDEIHIYSKQDKRLKIYKVQFIVLDPYRQNLSGATVQVLDSRGQLAATATTDEKGVANIEITYSPIYTVKISRGNYAIEGTFTLDLSNPGTIKLAKILEAERSYQSIVELINYTGEDMPVDKKCGCVCHTFLSGIWIFTMNLLYQVFKIRHVCCYDMFVVHGDKLKYGSN